MKQKLFSILALLLMAATGAWAQGYTVTLKGGTEDADNWTIEPKEGLTGDGTETVTITYNGSKRVKSVTAVKKAAVETMEFVEFTSGGKKVKFANMNLGATSVADGTKSYGDYYAWGATETFATVDYSTNPATVTPTEGHTGGYTQANAPHYSGSAYTKYNTTDNLTTLEAADDVVTATMGEGYRMPTHDDFMTLIAACGGTGESITPSSISSGTAYAKGIYWVAGATSAVTIGSDEYKANGVLFVQDPDTHVFFPVAGNMNGTKLSSWGSYWSSTLSTNGTQYAKGLFFGKNVFSHNSEIIRYFGLTVRPVQEGTLLSTITSDYTAQNGETLYGKLGSNVKISIADGAKVTLKDVNINGSGTWTSGDYAGITCAGDATITLKGTNTLKGFHKHYPGIYVPVGKTLTIEGEGSLNASSDDASGIGAGYGYDNSCGNIVINGGNITATAKANKENSSAGIGGGDGGHAGDITINGGTVTATGTSGAAGIGGGSGADVGNITITGGTVTATGGQKGAGIGGSNQRGFGDILISGGTVTAKGGDEAAGIGGGRRNGRYASCGTIYITSGVTQVTATKGGSSAPKSIGKGNKGNDITVTIEDPSKVTQN